MTRPSLPLAWLVCLLLSSCSSPPKPPTVDESTRRPVNSAMAVDLQTCRSELENTRIVAADSARGAEAAVLQVWRDVGGAHTRETDPGAPGDRHLPGRAPRRRG